jgi:ABC-type Mn2+/Zn2+ transport system ATPase subunit
MAGVGHVECAGIRFELPDGRVLLDDVSFRVGDGAKVALVGANGAGKTTLLRMITGDVVPHAGTISRSGGLGVMRQMVSQGHEDWTVRDLLLSVAPPRVRTAAHEVDRIELALMETDDEKTQMRYAGALAEYADAGGYDAEVLWDACTTAAIGVAYERCKHRDLATLSGGEQKRLVLEALLRGPDEVLLLDEPDNFLDVPGKRWLRSAPARPKTSAVRQPRPRAAGQHATGSCTSRYGPGATGCGRTRWFRAYHRRRADRLRAAGGAAPRWDEDHAKLKALVLMYKTEGRVQRRAGQPLPGGEDPLGEVRAIGPPETVPSEQQADDAAQGAAAPASAPVICEQLELTG